MAMENISRACRDCKRDFWLEVDADKYKRWLNGEGLIQDMLPNVPEDLRELLITSTCGECFDKLLADDDEMEGDDCK